MTDGWGRPAEHQEQWLWQRRAAAELVAILTAHPDLPSIAWTLAPAGCTLAGRVDPWAPAAQVRAVFAGWVSALGLHEASRRAGEGAGHGGTVYLHAVAERNRVHLVLTATVDDEPVQS